MKLALAVGGALLGAMVVGCSSDPSTSSASLDAGALADSTTAQDSGGPASDTGATLDTGIALQDSSAATDTGTAADTGVADTSVADTSIADTSVPDTGVDAGLGACTKASDCRLFGNMCLGCSCDALGPGQSNPKCTSLPVSCLIPPCQGKTANCNLTTHRCEAQ